ncbi:MAG: Uma2 family endonuclease [Armatimonadota bacterium]
MAVPLLRRRFTVDEYYRMADAGIFSEDDRVELIEGEIVEMVPTGSQHAGYVGKLNRILSSRVGESAFVWVQNPVRLSEHSEPLPDLALLRPRADFYTSAHPGPDDILLLVEVAETSAEYDRGVKVSLYSRYGAREFWLIDLRQEAVEVYRAPAPEGYREIQTVRRGGQLTIEALPTIGLSVDEIFG